MSSTETADSLKIFLDIGHPAHVHYFKHLIREMEEKGHSFVITARDKEMAHYLLKHEGFDYINRGSGSESLIGKFWYTLKADRQLWSVARKEKPGLFLSFASPYCAHVSKLMGKPHITLDDTETARIGQALYRPFTDVILTPESFQRDFGKKQVRFPSFIEMAYLHPSRFTPDPAIRNELGVTENEKYVIMRFVAWTANHDLGQKGVSMEKRIKAVEAFSKYARVFISSEKQLPEEFEKYRLPIKPHRIHHALAYSSLVFGESGTMSSEAAMLGTPAIFINNLKDQLGTLKAQEEKYGFVYGYSCSEDDLIMSIEKGSYILKNKSEYILQYKNLIDESVDMTSYLEWFILNYPQSRSEQYIESVSN